MTKKNLGIIVAAVIIAVSFGGFVYHTHIATAKAAVSKQALMASIDKQQAQEAAAWQEKENKPVVSESHPSRIVTKEVPDATQGTTKPSDQTPAPTTPKTETSSTEVVKTIPQQSPAPLPTVSTKPTPAPVNQDSVPAITSLSDSDIQRLQSYPTYGSTGQGGYESFSGFYANPHNQAESLPSKFSPTTLSIYNKAKVGWITSPKLIYWTVMDQIAYRGILTLTYYGDNLFGLTPNVTYQREVEYRLENSVETGFAFSDVKYLSDFRAVK